MGAWFRLMFSGVSVQGAAGEDEIFDALCFVHLRTGDSVAEKALFSGRGCRFEGRLVDEFLGQRGSQRRLLTVTEKLLRKRVVEKRALLGGLVLRQRQGVERPDVVDEARVRDALRDLVVQRDHVADGGRVVGDHGQRVLAGLGRAAQRAKPRGCDHGAHGSHAGLDVRRERTADASGERPDPGGGGVCRVVPGLEDIGAAARDDPGRLVAFVLQGLHQAGDLLSEVGELRHAAESGRAVSRRRYPQAAEDQAHDQRQHDHCDQPPEHRPVPQGERPRTREGKDGRFRGALVVIAGALLGAHHPMVSHCSCPCWLRARFKPPRHRRDRRGRGAPQASVFPSGGTEMGCRHSNGAVAQNIGK